MLSSDLRFTVKVTASFLWGLQGKQPCISICEHTCSLCGVGARCFQSHYLPVMFIRHGCAEMDSMPQCRT